jgi:B-box zinc finger.
LPRFSLQLHIKCDFSLQLHIKCDFSLQLHIKCDEDESHIAVLYCTVCASHLCEQCASDSHATRTLQKHRRIPLSEKPREKPFCSSHPTNIAEFICLEEHCQTSAQYPPLMCFICKDYGRHKTHKHALVEIEAENLRSYVKNASSNVQHLIEEITESVNTVGEYLTTYRTVINRIE